MVQGPHTSSPAPLQEIFTVSVHLAACAQFCHQRAGKPDNSTIFACNYIRQHFLSAKHKSIKIAQKTYITTHAHRLTTG